MSLTKRQLLSRFAIRAGLLFIAWILVYHVILVPYTSLNTILTQAVIAGTDFGLGLFGYETFIRDHIVFISDQSTVLIQDGCNGLELYALYAGFLIAFPGRWKFKFTFIPIGIFLIYTINVFRNIALALNYRYFQETFEFNHKYTYVLIVYLFVFFLWRYWMNRYSVLSHNES